jgi:ubiquinone/menaquinone biosynthesis C-methylase UbiE
MAGDIKQYWEQRAQENAGSVTATTNDVYLRDLEIKTFIDTVADLKLADAARVLDLGCGDGYTTIEVARAFPRLLFTGMDYSENMIASARERLKVESELQNTLQFVVGDATKLEQFDPLGQFDLILSDRCLINLESSQAQYDIMRQIASVLRSGGHYVAIENFVEGHDNMNQARRAVGLPEISIRWHNLFFREAEFIERAGQWFGRVEFKDFSSAYYYATRVIYSAMCKMRGEEPDYHHEIHQLAPSLPWFGQYSPIRMVILSKV